MLKPKGLVASSFAIKNDPQLINNVLLLLFGTCSDFEISKSVLIYRSIARLIRVPVTSVIDLRLE